MGWIQDYLLPLFEGFNGRSAERVRKAMVSDKEKAAEQVRKSQYTPQSGGWSLLDAAGYGPLADHLAIENDLVSRFLDYEEMDDFPELHAALDIYADDATQEDSMRNHSVWVTSENARVRDIANELLHQTLRIEEDLWGIARTLAKYGNQYAEVLLADGKGVVGLAFMAPATVRRVETQDGSLLGFVQDLSGKGVTPEDFKKMMELAATSKDAAKSVADSSPGVVAFEGWEVIHWRTRGKWMRSMYGHSVLESARWVWRRLVLLEDAAMLYKLTRAPARYAYYIDTGDLNPKQALAYVSDVKRNHKKNKYVNSQGKLEFKVNPLAQDEDFWVPTRGGKDSTRIELLSGADWQSMDDLRYFRQKLLAAIKIPAQYIGMSDQGDDARASLSSQDVRFARTIMRLQRELRAGIRKIVRIHLAAVGVDPNSVEWDVHMAVPSSIFELAQIEVRNAQADLAARMEPFVSKDWLMTNVFDFAADEAKSMRAAQKNDSEDSVLRDAKIQAKANKILGVDAAPGDFDVTDDKQSQPAAETGATSKQAGTGDTSPSPNKGKQESASVRLKSLLESVNSGKRKRV
jgi:hypothetical protein